jgi:site-specific DNA recombinase
MAFADDDDPLAADVLRAAIPKIDRQIADVRQQLAAISSGHALDGLWGLTFAQWDALPLPRRRAAVQALVKVTILPSGRRGPGFDPATVRVEDV